MIREEYIEEIKKHILSARIEKVYNADLVVKNNGENSLIFPSFNQIIEYVNKASNVDKFFERINTTLDNYDKYVKGNNVSKIKVTLEPLEKRIKVSEETINKLLDKLDESLNFQEFSKYDIKKITSLTFNDEYSDSLNFLFDLLVKLSKKVKDYIVKNSIWNTAYKVDFEESIKDFKKDEPIKVLSTINDKEKKIIDKVYVPDFLSDGTEDLNEMMKSFWLGLSALLYFSKPLEHVTYEVEGSTVKDIKDWLKDKVANHYVALDTLLSDQSTFKNYSDIEIREIYEKINKIKIPKEINPRSESDMPNKKCKAEQRLAELIGLDSVKEAVDKIVAYTKASKGSSSLNLHMAFYGNPGTGKTEVGKLIGEILYENGVLPKKVCIEATRSDLVGQYIGETALKTQALIQKAMGGVLFIDEAYSLAIEGDSIDFGNEAVAELIKEMEDKKGKFCVILAGYKNKLSKMLATNPGFNSRIQFHLDFENFNRDEMCDIIKLMLDKDGYIVTEDALNKMLDIVDVLRKNPDFANARDARNIIQQCVMCLNVRTGDPNDKTITLEDVNKYIQDAKLNLPTGQSTKKVLSGEEELNELIGLENVKTSVKKIRAYAKKNKGASNLNLHMAFTGNPGTGKTEVAHIISRVLYEAGVLPEAKVIIGNRETLVGQYVGQTAIKTKEAVQKAMGGVLFIDEAYSLSSDAGGAHDFGAEAIATLIDEMENNKGKFCVIVAGYEMPLKQMVASNPGFNSRIQFWIDFPDYSRDELKAIILRFLSKESVKYTITDDALEEMLDITDYYRSMSDFANARTVRKMLQDIIMNQNLRVEDELDNNEITIDDVLQYAKDNGLSKKSKVDANEGVDKDAIISHIIECSKSFDATKIDNNYYEQAVVSISDESSQGTGFIITPAGLCMTCAHCLKTDGTQQKARVIIALDDGQKIANYVDFNILFVDSFNDFALIELQSIGFNYKYLPLELDYNVRLDSLREFIMAGYPFGGESFSKISLTKGSIASVNRVDGRTVVFADMFGKPGSSGSPVIDIDSKKVIGIFWGGISKPEYGEKINCFTPSDIIWNSFRKG